MTISKKAITYAIVAALTVVLSSSFVSSALAANPHFISASASIDRNGNLICSFKEAGLGDSETDTITCTAQATAVYQCYNKPGNKPSAENKQTVSGPVSGTDSFTSSKNGQITGSVTVAPPSAGGFSCPNGLVLFLDSITYTAITITSPKAGTETVPGTIGGFVHIRL